jgi:hypothetical protein
LPKAAIQPVSIAIEPGSGRSAVLAYAKIFMASAAVTLNVAGVVIVGASGQRIIITLGRRRAGPTNLVVSPLGLIVPETRGVVG